MNVTPAAPDNRFPTYAVAVIVLAAAASVAAFVLWPRPLTGGALVGALVLSAAGALLVYCEIPLQEDWSIRLEVLAVLLAFAAYGPGAAVITAVAAAGFREWRSQRSVRGALTGAAVAVLAVDAMLVVYGILVGDLIFGARVGALAVREGGLVAARAVTGLFLGALVYKAVVELFLDERGWRTRSWDEEVRRWGYIAAAVAAAATGLAVSYPLLGSATIVMLGPLGALGWAIGIRYRAGRPSEQVGLQEKLTSIVVIGLSAALILAVGGIGVFFTRQYLGEILNRYQVLGDGLARGLTLQATGDNTARDRAEIQREIAELVAEEPGLAYVLIGDPGRADVLAFSAQDRWSELVGPITAQVAPLTIPGRYRLAWAGTDRSLSVEDVAVRLEGGGGSATLHLGVDRAILISRLRGMALVLSVIFAGAFGIAVVGLRRFGALELVSPLRRVTAVVRHLSEGDADLRERLDENRRARDELSQLSSGFNQFMVNLHEIIRTARDTGREVAVSADRLASSATQLNDSADEIAHNMTGVIERLENEEQKLREVGSVTERLAGSVEGMTRSAQASAASGDRIRQMAAQSRGRVESAVDTLVDVRDVVERSGQAIRELVATTRQVSELVHTVAVIADQTDLLALNASIEAARAGEHGLGFAVVAEEIRKLAEESASASERAGEIIRHVERRVDEVVAAMGAAQEEVSGVQTVARTAREALDQIDVSLQELGQSVTSMANQMREEAGQVREIQRLVSGIVEFSESNVDSAAGVSAATNEQSASTQEIAAGSRQLNSSAERLLRLIERFKV